MKKKLALTSVAFLTAITLAGCSTSDTVATTPAGDITKDELYDAMKASIGETVLQRLILIDVLNDAIGKNELEAETEAELLTTIEQYGGEETFNYILSQSGFANKEEYKDVLYLNKLIEAAVKAETTFTDEEVEAYYEAYQPQINVQHILVADEATAVDLINQINEGADFAELAAANSTDTGTASNGGETGLFGAGDMVAAFEEAAYALEVGEVTQTPVATEYGYHIIKMIEKTEKGTLEEERENIETVMMDEKLADNDYLTSVMSTIVQAANVEIKDEDLAAAIDQFLPAEESSSSDATSEEISSETATSEEAESATAESAN
ncbi:peptidylprolyl isomerase [uncultured Trichococcus sp.]|uniref:peptidylprolyl isomerase n=1 Tax=uncultured Trichococcus sp. TaxID=189665 RepID=UPI002A18930B|nr:peptidylprolyl isomerase [uncultured Trichococcus sp.]